MRLKLDNRMQLQKKVAVCACVRRHQYSSCWSTAYGQTPRDKQITPIFELALYALLYTLSMTDTDEKP